jgi:hypothetical protein
MRRPGFATADGAHAEIVHAGNSKPHQDSGARNAEIAEPTVADDEKPHRCDAYGDDNRQDGFNDIVVYEHRELDGHHGGEMH